MTTRMALEISEQPMTVRRTLAELLPLRTDLARLFEGRRRVLFSGRGTSDNAAVFGRYLLETHAGVPAGLLSPSVATHYHARLDLSDALVVSVSQSGATQEIVATQEWARSCGAATVAVANAAGSPLVEQADLALVTRAGRELAVPATKTYLAQLVAMATIGTALAPDPTALDPHLDRAADAVATLLERRAGVEAAAARLAESAYAVVTGRGLMLGTAQEIALKLEETCLRPVRGFSYADLRHGPIAVVTEGMAALLVAAPDGPFTTPMADLATDLGQRGATVVGVGGDAAFATACAVHLPGPDLPEPLAPLGAVVPGQLVAERLARTLGLDPDAPRGLTKLTATESPHPDF